MRDLIPLNVPTDGVVLAVEDVVVKNREGSYGTGRLFITEENVRWITSELRGFVLSYFEISLHAVSKDVTNFPEECIYLMLDAGKEESEEDSEPEENGLDAEMNGGTHAPEKELYFIPNDKSMLDSIFTAMAHCQSLHPDPEDVGSDDDAMHDEEESGMGEGGGGGDLTYDYGRGDERYGSDNDEDHLPDNAHHFGSGDH
ncbi:hypothetical protein RvY_09675 [Ramazzottius varieornatus]|uniref:Methylosome subunit pICln n=1 Tax=Ramazzottius varieornatus TaxID=947166 RepID=A0A1D1VI09_RAMVA|nr:hypothetical protein RvY_09675 [Ramazzottius varieornatus]